MGRPDAGKGRDAVANHFSQAVVILEENSERFPMILLDRRSFMQSLAGIFALGILDRRELRPRMAMKLSELRHPDPRPNITAEHVMTSADLGKLSDKKGVMAAYDGARAY